MPRTRPRISEGLFERIARFDALFLAARRAIKGKRRSPGAASFMANVERECLILERRLKEGSWRPGRFAVMLIKDPKPRRISAAPFRDRVVHHAIMHVIEPIFERGFIAQSFANRVGYGSHRGVELYERERGLLHRVVHLMREINLVGDVSPGADSNADPLRGYSLAPGRTITPCTRPPLGR